MTGPLYGLPLLWMWSVALKVHFGARTGARAVACWEDVASAGANDGLRMTAYTAMLHSSSTPLIAIRTQAGHSRARRPDGGGPPPDRLQAGYPWPG